MAGGVPGTLIYLSADTLTEPGPNGQPQTFYRGRIRLDDAALKAHPKLRGVVLKPGMGVTADVRTGQRSVLQYLFSPVLRGTSGALRER